MCKLKFFRLHWNQVTFNQSEWPYKNARVNWFVCGMWSVLSTCSVKESHHCSGSTLWGGYQFSVTLGSLQCLWISKEVTHCTRFRLFSLVVMEGGGIRDVRHPQNFISPKRMLFLRLMMFDISHRGLLWREAAGSSSRTLCLIPMFSVPLHPEFW